MQKIHVVYFHGYKNEVSNQPSSKALKLISAGFKVYTPTIPLLFDEAIAYLKNYLNALDFENESFVFAGTSLGGYWANAMANHYCIPAILINPSCQPSQTLQQYQNPLMTKTELEKYTDAKVRLGIPRVVMLAKQDAVIDYRVAATLFDKKAQVILFDKADHRFESAPIAEYIDDLIAHDYVDYHHE